jgi:hypothetical protein
MAALTIECYVNQSEDGSGDASGVFLGKQSIAVLSNTSQSVALPVGTRIVRLATDAAETVFFIFGKGSATATTASQELRAAEEENFRWAGLGVPGATHIAARVA